MKVIKINRKAGSKAKLAKRVLKREEAGGDESEMMEEVKKFLEPKRVSAEQPKIISHYGRSFNSVDRFNKLLSYVSYRPKIGDEKLRVLVALVEIALVQSWALTIDWRGERVGESQHILTSARDLALSLHPKK